MRTALFDHLRTVKLDQNPKIVDGIQFQRVVCCAGQSSEFTLGIIRNPKVSAVSVGEAGHRISTRRAR